MIAGLLVKCRRPVSNNMCFALPRRIVPQALFARFTMAASVPFEADAAGTRAGELPPWGSAKVVAFHVVLTDVAELLDSRAADLVGMRLSLIHI